MTSKDYPEISVGRLFEKIVEHIEKRILDGELKPGDRLPAERELGQQFGVSRTSVREAIRVLALKGLIEVNHGRGTFVTDQTTRAARHSLNLLVQFESKENPIYLIEVREILEPAIAALAAQRATTEQIAAMRESIAAMDSAITNPDAYIEADLDFHLALADASQNPIILILLDLLIGQLRAQRFLAASVDGSLGRSQAHHKNVFTAVERRDAAGAREAMQDHMKQIRTDIRTAVHNEES